MNIRTARSDDAASLANLSGQLGYQARPGQLEQRLHLLLPHPDHHILVALVDEKVVGWLHACITVTVESDPWAEIAGLVVDEEHRNKGIGKRLVQEALAWASTKDVQKIRVRSNVIREEAHRFYRNLGFKESKAQKVFDMMLDQNQLH